MSLTQSCEKSGGRGKHRLYKEETFISEPIDSTGEFLVSCDGSISTVPFISKSPWMFRNTTFSQL